MCMFIIWKFVNSDDKYSEVKATLYTYFIGSILTNIVIDITGVFYQECISIDVIL
jgi:hypothetical protein